MEQVGGGGGEESEGWWDVQHHKERHVKKFGVRQHDITFRPSPAFVDRQQGNDLAATLNDLDRSLKGLVRRAMTESGLTTSERAAITLQSPKLDHPIRLSWMPVSNITDEVIENTFNRVVQSHKDFVIDEGVAVNVIAMEDQRGGGGRKKHVSSRINVMENMKHDSNIMCPPMDSGDEMCLARCLTYGMIWHHRQERHRARNLRRLCDNEERWTCKAHSLCVAAGVERHVPAGQDALEKFETHLRPQGFTIRAFTLDHQDPLFFKSYPPEETKALDVVLVGGHYMFIKNVARYFNKDYFCNLCCTPFDRRMRHRCARLCQACKHETCTECQHSEGRTLQCPVCKRYFFGTQCRRRHLDGDGQCPNLWRYCEECHHEYQHDARHAHKCGERYCKVCNTIRPQEHRCFVPVHRFRRLPKPSRATVLRPARRVAPHCQAVDLLDTALVPDAIDNRVNMVFFDIETQQETGEHIPTLVIAQTMLGEEEHVFEGDTCIVEFLEYLLVHVEGESRTTVVAHNGRGFDFQFILRTLLEQGRRPDVVMNGAKIISLQWGGLRFVDSLSFIVAPLSKFPKMFGLHLEQSETLLAKGFFPHLFHTRENMENDYRGPMPPRETYDPNGMSVEKRREFDAWYQAQVDVQREFHLRQEVVAYCSVDVTILRQGVLTFCREFQRLNDVNPFAQAITLPSICNKVYRAQHMPVDTIPYVPANGYAPQNNQSHVALEWLLWLNEKPEWNHQIQHVWNGGEYVPRDARVGPVDGFHAPTRTCFEFKGCYWHGCKSCYRDTDQNTRLERPMEELYRIAFVKEEKLRRQDYRVVVMWECEWRRQKETDPALALWCHDHDLVEPLDIRKAFYGGRTGCTKLWSRVVPGGVDRLDYLDFKSLYPSCNINRRRDEIITLPEDDDGENEQPTAGPSEPLGSWDVDDPDPYPVGHPVIRRYTETGEGELPLDIGDIYGFIKCDVEAPSQGLYHPVLPYRCRNKLTFPLCRSCAESQAQELCTHTPEERFLRGTWVSEEVKLALRKGYRIRRVWETYHYPQRSRHLFRSYVLKFQQAKEHASGWPPHVTTPEQRAAYVQDYEAHEGVRLDPDRMHFNPGVRAIAKHELNSLWGKFGESPNKITTEYITEVPTWLRLATSPRHDVHAVYPVNEDMIMVMYNLHEEYADSLTNDMCTSVSIAAWTTWLARKKLYVEVLDVLKERVCYMDTDSCIFETRPGDDRQAVTVGTYFGDLTDEISGEYGPDATMVEFASAGPKNYGFRVSTGATKVKVRGISLTVRVRETLNWNSMLMAITNVVEDVSAGLSPEEAADEHAMIVEYPHSIRRAGHALKHIVSKDMRKTYKAVIGKRMMVASLLGRGFDAGRWHVFETLPFGTCSVDP